MKSCPGQSIFIFLAQTTDHQAHFKLTTSSLKAVLKSLKLEVIQTEPKILYLVSCLVILVVGKA